ncbi:hypothetical protein [Qipengyuania spongiae]|uniref:Phytoene synthase n=1 Tax=Qipengyuania spongiae TaxID=2909673 RepID=A0ABY5T085_9SPHN|nr:hypothetical protein [Qipengyuania spongiae]UVI38904.1 hypothetical protein L1F33_11735 [Qipengyuania spongiae]
MPDKKRVSHTFPTDLPELGRLALASARAGDRPLFEIVFALDARLARLVSGTTETMLGQLRLSWWRDQLAGTGPIDRRGEPLLERIDEAWAADRQPLGELVDGWEGFLLAESNGWRSVAEGRAAAFVAIARSIGSSSTADSIDRAVRNWTFAEIGRDKSANPGDQVQIKHGTRLDRPMRPLAVLAGLARRALRSDRRDLMGGRTLPFAAMRLGIFGR